MLGILQYLQDQHLYIVEGPFDHTMLSICVKVGCDAEPEGSSGLAHLVEHICLSYRHAHSSSDSTGVEYKRLGFHFSGHTNYGQTVLHLSFANDANALRGASRIIREIEAGAVVTPRNLEMSKHETMLECDELAERWNIQSMVIPWITGGAVKKLPVGIKEEIARLTERDAAKFLMKYYQVYNMGVIVQTGLPIEMVKREFRFVIGGCPGGIKESLAFERELPRRGHYSAGPATLMIDGAAPKMEMYFETNYRPLDMKQKVTRILFETVTGNFIGNDPALIRPSGFQHAFVSDKHITDSFYFCVIEIALTEGRRNDLIQWAEALEVRLKSVVFSEDEILSAKDWIRAFLSVDSFTKQPLMEHIFDNLSANFFYGEPVHILTEHFSFIESILSELGAADVNEYKNNALVAPCKFVITA